MIQQFISIICLIYITVFSHTVFAEDNSEFEMWMQQEVSSFDEYRDKRDKEFTHFLQSQWKEMKTFQGYKRDPTPKPLRIPKAPEQKSEPAQTDNVKPIIIDSVLNPEAESLPKDALPPITPALIKHEDPTEIDILPLPSKQDNSKLTLQFYGQSLIFYYDSNLKVHLQRPFNEHSISKIWSQLSKANYEYLLKQIEAQRQPLNLNDWSFSLLINSVSQMIHATSKNDQAVFTWFLMTKAGYQARIAYDKNYVYLLLPSLQKLFSAPYFKLDNVRYYSLSFDGVKQKPGRIFTYNGNYPGAHKRLDFRLNKTFNTLRKNTDRFLSFDYNDKSYRINVGYDSHTIDYLKSYPQLDISYYFISQVSHETASPLIEQLKILVQDRSEKDAVNFLLRFVQTAFKYKTDEQQFGDENYLFPEETLHYPFSDCEDRSVFFAWLVHSLLNLNVIGLNFPGHIATAVNFNDVVSGDSIIYKGKHYVISDPTYINATVGMTMPAYKNIKPSVISVLN